MASTTAATRAAATFRRGTIIDGLRTARLTTRKPELMMSYLRACSKNSKKCWAAASRRTRTRLNAVDLPRPAGPRARGRPAPRAPAPGETSAPRRRPARRSRKRSCRAPERSPAPTAASRCSRAGAPPAATAGRPWWPQDPVLEPGQSLSSPQAQEGMVLGWLVVVSTIDKRHRGALLELARGARHSRAARHRSPASQGCSSSPTPSCPADTPSSLARGRAIETAPSRSSDREGGPLGERNVRELAAGASGRIGRSGRRRRHQGGRHPAASSVPSGCREPTHGPHEAAPLSARRLRARLAGARGPDRWLRGRQS